MKQRTRVLLSVSLACLLLVTAVVAGRWVYAASPGWRFFDIEFHPSWSEEERAAILRLDENCDTRLLRKVRLSERAVWRVWSCCCSGGPAIAEPISVKKTSPESANCSTNTPNRKKNSPENCLFLLIPCGKQAVLSLLNRWAGV